MPPLSTNTPPEAGDPRKLTICLNKTGASGVDFEKDKMKTDKPSLPTDKVGLPFFAYHPNPLATGSIRVGAERCACCGRERGYIYTASVYGRNDLEGQLCPWCIADGSAAEQHGASFSDESSLVQSGVSTEVVEEVTRRTPGYNSWQQEQWLACCGDACEFHGHPPREHLPLMDPTAVEQFLSATGWTPEQWLEFSSNYKPDGSPALYHFVCRCCGKPHYGCDQG